MSKAILYSLIALGMILPTAFTPLKMAMLLLLFVAAFVRRKHGVWRLDRDLYLLSVAAASVGLIWSIYGYARGNPGAIPVLTVTVIYPLILPVVYSIVGRSDSENLFKLFVVVSFTLIGMDGLLVLSAFVPTLSWYADLLRAVYDQAITDRSTSYFKFTIPNISSFLFLVPFFLVALITGYRANGIGVAWMYLIVLGLVGIAFLSGRRALIITSVLGPSIAYLLTLGANPSSQNRLRERNRFLPDTFSVVVAIAAIGLVAWAAVEMVGASFFVQRAVSVLDFQENSSNLERAIQARVLVAGIQSAPFFGHGAGAVASYTRSIESPWSYELFYLATVYQYGLIGFTIYAGLVCMIIRWLVIQVKAHGRGGFEYCFLAGFISFMMATATNPYLGKFDYMWIIFIPYALMNGLGTIRFDKKEVV